MRKFIFVIIILCYSQSYFSQQPKFNFSFSNDLLFKKEKPLLFFSEPQQQFSVKPIYSLLTVTQTNKKPMFCKMEDRLHKRFNVWILLRAGSDADYRKLIESQN